jgi:hypothetical protein
LEGVVSTYHEVDFAELTDVHGERVYGLHTEGMGRLLVWDLIPLVGWPHPCLWVALVPPEGEPVIDAEDENVRSVIHNWPPKEARE